jgi:hypothetical protein
MLPDPPREPARPPAAWPQWPLPLALALCLATAGVLGAAAAAAAPGQWQLLRAPGAGEASPSAHRSCAAQPLLSGAFNASQPPYFFPEQCELRAWGPDAARRCLQGRRVFILGNSIARGLAFEALSGFFDGPTVLRQDQKAECQPSCTVPLGQAEANISVDFVWTQRLGPAFAWCTRYPEPCYPRAPAECLGDTLSGSRPGDVLITYLGLYYASLWADWELVQRTGKTLSCEGGNADFREGLAAVADEEALEQATAADLEHWVGAVQGAWGGLPEHVFRVRLAPLGDYWGTGKWAHRVEWLNGLFDAAAQDAQWSTVDQYGINQGPEWDYDEGRPVIPPHYADHVHFPGVLSAVTWEVVLSQLCE